MLKAVLALTKTPQNNLRIFKVGAKKKEMKTLNDLVLLLVIHRRDSYLDWVFGGGTGWKPGFRRRVPNQPHGHLERMVP